MNRARKISGAGYIIDYGGDRLADIVVDGTAVECVQVAEYDWREGKVTSDPTDDEIRAAVAEDLGEDLNEYMIAAGVIPPPTCQRPGCSRPAMFRGGRSCYDHSRGA